VIGGVSVDPAAVPWYASGFCGGTLVAPDRVVTAAHCVDGLSPTDLRGVVVGGATHEIEHVSMHPRWREANGPENFVWDLAILEL
jgi:secreted trypsin-like serine protease